MARNKQLANCLFCNKLPCECDGPPKEKKPRAKKTNASKVRHKAEPLAPTTEGVVEDGGQVPPSKNPLLEDESVPEFPSESGRKRARFTKGSNKAPSRDVPDSRQESSRLAMEEEAVAIRNLASAGLLHPTVLKKYQHLIEPKRGVDLDRRLHDWRARR